MTYLKTFAERYNGSAAHSPIAQTLEFATCVTKLAQPAALVVGLVVIKGLLYLSASGVAEYRFIFVCLLFGAPLLP
jgi:hypothetical protein